MNTNSMYCADAKNCSCEMCNECCGNVNVSDCGNPMYNVFSWNSPRKCCYRPELCAIDILCYYLTKGEAAEIYVNNRELLDFLNEVKNVYETKERVFEILQDLLDKIDSITASCEWDDIKDKPSFATVATSGDYSDLNNKPVFKTVNNESVLGDGNIEIVVESDDHFDENSENSILNRIVANAINTIKDGSDKSIKLLDLQNELIVQRVGSLETAIEIIGDATNAPDEEDLTSVNIEGTDVLKFKDKVYNPLVYSGLGRKILRKNIVGGVNTLTQSMINQANTTYVIQYDYNLGGETVTIPANCVLEFDGGSLNNGRIVLDDADIYAGRYQIFGDNLIVVSYTRELAPNAGHFQPVKKRTLYASWFGLGDDGTHNPEGNNADKFEKAVETLKNNGKLIVDTGIYIERPVVVRDLFYTIIEGEIGNDSINVCIPYIYSGYTPEGEGASVNLFEFYSEGLLLRNIRFTWGLNESDTGGGLRCNSVLYIRPNGNLAEIDCVIEGCQIDSYKFGDPINAKGRGLYIRNNVIHHPFATGAYKRAMIRLVGYWNGDDRTYFKAKDANRATVIQNNRFHVGFNNYIVWFEQDPNNAESTFSNTIVTNNLCDFGCYGIYSESRIRSLTVSNNAFSVMAHGTTGHYQFNYFKNSVNGFNFTGNSLSVIEDATIETIRRGGGETWFEYPAKVEGEDYDVTFENINISCNTYDVYNMSCIARFDGRNGASDTAYPTLKQICIGNNTVSDRCLSGGSLSVYKSIVTIVNCSLNSVAVMGNAIRSVGDYNTYTAYLANVVDSQYPAKTYSYENVIFSLNSGIYGDIYTDAVNQTYLENVITTSKLRPLMSTIAWGYRNDTTRSTSIFDVNLGRQLWWDNKRWVDNDGYSGAQKRGTTNERPTKYLVTVDSGFRYFDTDLGKDIIYKDSMGRWVFDHENTVEDDETHTIKFDTLNTLEEGALYILSINTFNNAHHLYFYNSESPETKIDVIAEARTQGYANFYNMLTQFEAPDPTVYDRILITTARETEFSIIEYNAWWEELDGAKAGVRRSGAFAQAPIAADIYTGFMYMLVDGANNFPLYAKVSGNPATVAWYKADGTQYNG